MDIDQYCREIEAYLCRRNRGHLVRLVGPAFDLARGWASAGIPLNVVYQGIDRRLERASARGSARRPMRIEFCEADVLDAFDAWRRAVGVHGVSGAAEETAGEAGDGGLGDGAAAARRGGRTEPGPARRSRESLSTHVDRVIVRLTALRTGGAAGEWDAVLDGLVRRLDALHPAARRARGEARERILADLAALDAEMLERARACAPPGVVADVEREAEADLEPFAARLAPAALAAARRRVADRALRERLRLPVLTLD
ncbi:MAG TPA: hypothetical protein PLN93_06490 [Vicinamibacterales bacterium]|nr:hypothetical protein [Vicinamibacterales bacterium]HPK71570.1 hypothetical protein [Vicinamibacterales bacterium]